MSIIQIPEHERKAAGKLAQALHDAIKSLSDDEIAPAMNAFYKAKQDNCWFMIYALKHFAPGLLAHEASERKLDIKDYFAKSMFEEREKGHLNRG